MKRIILIITLLGVFIIPQFCLSQIVQKDSVTKAKVGSEKINSSNIQVINQFDIDKDFVKKVDAINDNLTKLTESNTFLGISLDLIATILIPISIFILGYIIDHIIKGKINSIEIKDYRDTIFFGVESNTEVLESNITTLKNFSEDIAKTKDLEALPLIYKMSEIHQLNTIPFEKYISVLLLKSKGNRCEKVDKKKVTDLINSIDYLSRSESMVMNKYQEYHNCFNNLFLKSNDYYLAICDIIQEKYLNIASITTESEQLFWIQLAKMLKNYEANVSNSSNEMKRGEIMFTQLVTPMLEHINNSQISNMPIEIMKIVGQLSVLLRQWEHNKTGYAKLFIEYSKNISRSLTSLKESVTYLKINTKEKCLC